MAVKKKKAPKKKNRLITVLLWILAVLVVLLCVMIGAMCYIVWCDYQTVFQNVTVELGTQTLSIRDFMTDKAKPQRVSFVSNPSTIDLSKAGRTQITLKHGIRNYKVVLTVQDTVAPTAVIESERVLSVSDPLPEAKDLVSDIQDEAPVEVYYVQEPQMPRDYSDVEVTIVVEDASGNKIQQPCLLRFQGWLRESLTLEVGEELTKEMLLVYPEKDSDLLDDALIRGITTVGEHTVTASTGNNDAACVVTIQDTTKPKMKLKNVRIRPGEEFNINDFIDSLSDNAGTPELRLVGKEPDCSVRGTHTITIEAVDASGNVTSGEATLWVSKNLNPPEIKGAVQPLEVQKNEEPDYLKGVTAKDDIDRKVEITVDTSAVDLTTAGTYFITYSAIDSSGNEATYKRRVIVNPNEEDTDALIAKIAEELPDDPEAIRDYVHDTIAYSSNWGGDHPVWHGLTTNSGNCYVHANTLQKLLEYKGYETQMIWVTNKSHYWLIIKLDEGWRHIDSTPSEQHEKIGLATDRVRYLNLNGRNWDRSKWPACK